MSNIVEIYLTVQNVDLHKICYKQIVKGVNPFLSCCQLLLTLPKNSDLFLMHPLHTYYQEPILPIHQSTVFHEAVAFFTKITTEIVAHHQWVQCPNHAIGKAKKETGQPTSPI